MRFVNLPYHFGLCVRIYPNYKQRAIMKANSDASRFWYNRQLGLDYYRFDIMKLYGYGNYIYNPLVRKWYNNVYNKRKITYARKVFPWLKNKKIDSLALNSAYLNHNQAWSNEKHGLQRMPKFHSKKTHPYEWKYQTSCIYHKNKNGSQVGSVQILDQYHIKLPKIKRIRTSKIRNVIMQKYDIRIGRVTIRKDNLNDYYVSFQLGSMTPFVYLNKQSNQLAMIGYDLNTSNFLQDTNHDFVPNPRYYKRKASKYQWESKDLSRKYRHNRNRRLLDCKNYQRNRIRKSKLQKHVVNQRTNFLQNLSTEFIENQDFSVGENLQSSNMLKNHRIAKAIQSVGWRSFISMLKYKAIMYHKLYILVNPAYTTQKCSNCGYVCNKKDHTHINLGVEQWTCPKCGKHHIRDVNASINILRAGIKAVQAYLPKSLRISARMATNEHNQVQCSHQWLRYLVTHYYGVLDSTGRASDKLIPRN